MYSYTPTLPHFTRLNQHLFHDSFDFRIEGCFDCSDIRYVLEEVLCHFSSHYGNLHQSPFTAELLLSGGLGSYLFTSAFSWAFTSVKWRNQIWISDPRCWFSVDFTSAPCATLILIFYFLVIYLHSHSFLLNFTFYHLFNQPEVVIFFSLHFSNLDCLIRTENVHEL